MLPLNLATQDISMDASRLAVSTSAHSAADDIIVGKAAGTEVWDCGLSGHAVHCSNTERTDVLLYTCLAPARLFTTLWLRFFICKMGLK